MKFLLPFKIVFFLAIHAQIGGALECGGPISTPCLGDSDIRYDSNYLVDLIAQDPLWDAFEGYWKITSFITVDNEGNRIVPLVRDPDTFGRGPYGERIAFYNHTFNGSRFEGNRYYLHAPAPQEFCDRTQNVTPPLLNVFGDGECGVNGLLTAATFYGTSNYEKNGILDVFRNTGAYSPFEGPLDTVDPPSAYANVGEADMIQTSVLYPISQSASFHFTGEEKTGFQATSTTYNMITEKRGDTALISAVKITEAEFVEQLEEAYEEYGILDSDRYAIPFNDPFYPTENEWCGEVGKDPSCTMTPYQEPVASLKPGAIAGITVFIVFIVAASSFFFYRHKLDQQKTRIRAQFVRTVAENITIGPSAAAISPEMLLKEFEAIDSGNHDGYIQKEELRVFVKSGKMGSISDSDFAPLWSAMDIDNDGKIDFVEFCTFLSSCGKEIEQVHQEHKTMSRADMMKIASRRLSAQQVLLAGNDEVESE